jgi:hypothetical protein
MNDLNGTSVDKNSSDDDALVKMIFEKYKEKIFSAIENDPDMGKHRDKIVVDEVNFKIEYPEEIILLEYGNLESGVSPKGILRKIDEDFADNYGDLLGEYLDGLD